MDIGLLDHSAHRPSGWRRSLRSSRLLSGFSVQDRATLTVDRGMAPLDADLCVADVSVDPWTGFQATPVLCAEIAQAMRELLEEHPRLASCCAGTPSLGRFIDAREPFMSVGYPPVDLQRARRACLVPAHDRSRCARRRPTGRPR